MQRKKLPIGIQTFSEIRSGGHYYVDKSAYACRLADQGKYYFLSRPRRFGKSLFLDTLAELFACNRPLFEGLHAEGNWDWKAPHPVIRVSFGSGVVRGREELDRRIVQQLIDQREVLGLPAPATEPQDVAGRFTHLIRDAAAHFGRRAVVLIDEYDKPILDNLTAPERAIEAREGLRNFYSVLKDADPFLRFVLLAGVSKFSKVSLFSGLNNLRDITLVGEYSAICGYTDADVDTVFAAELPGLDRDQVRRWYNGYNWGAEAVYNPFDLLLLFEKREFSPYWFETATPTFLVELLAERQFFTPDLNRLQTSEALLGRFDVRDISSEALLFQAGYLTLAGVQELLPGKRLYSLSYPNLEVQISLNEALLPQLGIAADVALLNGVKVLGALRSGDIAALEAHLKALFAAIPHDWHRNNPIAQYEGYYASVFYSHFAALGLPVTVEDASRSGRVDMTIEHAGHLYLFEFKTVADRPDGRALEQILARGYADKYRARASLIHLVGVEFSRAQRQIVGFEHRTA
jgi:hypothetical protein